MIHKLSKIRLHQRNAHELAGLLRFHASRMLHCATPRKIANMAMVKVQKRLGMARVHGMPYRYRIEPLNVCNLRCPACATGLRAVGRAAGKMPMATYQAIIDQIAPYAYQLELYNYGEPLLHPRIFDMIRYAQQRNIAVLLSSHFNTFDQSMAEQLVASGLSHLTIAVDGSTQEVYEQYRRGGDLATVLKHVRLLVEEKERRRSRAPFITLRVLVTRHNEHQIADIRQIARDLRVDLFSTGQFFFDTTDPAQVSRWAPSQATQERYRHTGQFSDQRRCADLWEHMAINWDGGVTPCCWFSDQRHVFADSRAQSLRAIWNSDAYVHSRAVFSGHVPEGAHSTTCMVCKGRPLYLQGQMERR